LTYSECSDCEAPNVRRPPLVEQFLPTTDVLANRSGRPTIVERGRVGAAARVQGRPELAESVPREKMLSWFG